MGEKPFVEDLHNVLLTSLQNEAGDDWKDVVIRLCEGRVAPSYCTNVWVPERVKSSAFRPLVRSDSTHFTENAQNQVANVLDSLYQIEQEVRDECKKEDLSYYAVCEDLINIVDSLVLLEVAEAVSLNGFPFAHEHIMSTPGNLLKYHCILYHNASAGRFYHIEKYLKGVDEGGVHPQLYAHIIGTFTEDPNHVTMGTNYSIRLDQELYILTVAGELLDEINQNCADIALGSLHEYQDKIVFQHINPAFKLIYSATLSNFSAGIETTKALKARWDKFRVDSKTN